MGERWGLAEAWHYDCPDFPLHKDYSVAWMKPLRPRYPLTLSSNPDPKYDCLEKGKLLHIVVNLNASKKEILAWVGNFIDEFKKDHPRSASISDTKKIFEIFDRHQEGQNFWQITRESYPQIKGKTPSIDPEAKNLLKNVTDAYRKVVKIIDSIKPID